MTKVKVLRNGDSLGLVLPAEVVERLALQDGDELSVAEAGGTVVLSREPSLMERRREAIDHVLTVHARTLELLARR